MKTTMKTTNSVIQMLVLLSRREHRSTVLGYGDFVTWTSSKHEGMCHYFSVNGVGYTSVSGPG